MWQTLGYSPKDCQLGEMPVSACQSASGKPLIFSKYLLICGQNTKHFLSHGPQSGLACFQSEPDLMKTSIHIGGFSKGFVSLTENLVPKLCFALESIVIAKQECNLSLMVISFVGTLVICPDDGPGSLREGCRRKQPLWIVFEVSGTIALSTYCRVSSFKTVDGRGQHIKITGKGLQLKDCEHVIVCNLELDGGRGHDVDGIQMKPNTKHVWVDRCSISDFDDGCIDITRRSSDITVSR
jgi:hypothetical protein